MKKVTEKDLSLDKKEVSNLTGGSGAGNETDNELICASKVCTDSKYDICCAASVEDTCPAKCPLIQSKDFCPVTDDSLCDVCSDECSNAETCTCPLPDTKLC